MLNEDAYQAQLAELAGDPTPLPLESQAGLLLHALLGETEGDDTYLSPLEVCPCRLQAASARITYDLGWAADVVASGWQKFLDSYAAFCRDLN